MFGSKSDEEEELANMQPKSETKLYTKERNTQNQLFIILLLFTLATESIILITLTSIVLQILMLVLIIISIILYKIKGTVKETESYIQYNTHQALFDACINSPTLSYLLFTHYASIPSYRTMNDAGMMIVPLQENNEKVLFVLQTPSGSNVGFTARKTIKEFDDPVGLVFSNIVDEEGFQGMMQMAEKWAKLGTPAQQIQTIRKTFNKKSYKGVAEVLDKILNESKED